MKLLKLLFIIGKFILIFNVAYAQELNENIFEFISENKNLYKNAKIGLKIIDLQDNTVICSINESVSLTPASVMKLVTTYACLKKLGKDYVFKTPIFLENAIDTNGLSKGNIYIQGKGDPCLSTEDIAKACVGLAEVGLRYLEGNIVYDVSEFDEEKLRYFPNARDRYASPSALTVNYNAIKLTVIEKSEIKLLPNPDTEYAELNYEIEVENSNKPSKPEMLVVPKYQHDYYTIKGTITNWTKAIDYLAVAVTRPGLYFVTLFKENLKKQGISVQGNLVKGKIPDEIKIVYEIESKPLSEILKVMNKMSNNVIAEGLCKMLGAKYENIPGTRKKGLKVISDALMDLGFGEKSFILSDASGLANTSKLSAYQIVEILKDMFNSSDNKDVFVESLDILGKDKYAKYPIPPQGSSAFVKTGTLSNSGVNSVAGYIYNNKNDRKYAFCLIVNKAGKVAYSGTYTRGLLEKIMKFLNNYE